MHALSIVLQVLGVCWCISFTYLTFILVRCMRTDDSDVVERCADYTAHTGGRP